MSMPDQTDRSGTAVTDSSGSVTVTFSKPFPTGSTVNVMLTAVAPTGATGNYNAQLTSLPTTTGFTGKVNLQPASLSIAGLLSINPFSSAPAGVSVQWQARTQ